MPVQESVNVIRATSAQWAPDSVQRALLKESGLSLEDIECACVGLVKRSWVFAEADGLRTGTKHSTNSGNPRQVIRGTAAMAAGGGGAGGVGTAASVMATGPTSDISAKSAILFDFDGTLGDTELPAMEVAFWELAPYFPEASVEYLSTGTMETYVRNNAGKAFEFMVDVVEEDRKAAGMKPIEEVRAAGGEDPEVAKHVDKRRKKFGLPPLAETKSLKVRFRVKAEIV